MRSLSPFSVGLGTRGANTKSTGLSVDLARGGVDGVDVLAVISDRELFKMLQNA